MPIGLSVMFSAFAVVVFLIHYIIISGFRKDMHSPFGLTLASFGFSFLSLSIFATANWPTKEVEVFPRIVSEQVVVVDIDGEAHNVLGRGIRYEDISEKTPLVATVADKYFGFFESAFIPSFRLKKEGE